MADGDDLPDADYESIYGREALEARRDAQALALHLTMQRLHAQYERERARMQVLLDENPRRRK